MGYTVGSLCSGIEAASVAWKPLGFSFSWYCEIADFPSRLLREKYPDTPNLRDMFDVAELIERDEVDTPDILCAGTPCQAFSYAGWQKGLEDIRGSLSLELVRIVEANDSKRLAKGKRRSVVFWENVEGVLTDKTNAFGLLVSSLAGLDAPYVGDGRWPTAGLVRGPKRTVVWRVVDSKYFGLPQQRRRLYLIAGDHDLRLEEVLFEALDEEVFRKEYDQKEESIKFCKAGHQFEAFRGYTDCLYSSYATKWNGNAAANNGSLYFVQDGRVRRLSPLECERLMGFPDHYTDIAGAKKTNRYRALGNSWVIPVVKWIGSRIMCALNAHWEASSEDAAEISGTNFELCDFSSGEIIYRGKEWNCSDRPNRPVLGRIEDIASHEDVPDVYLSPVGSAGILRRAKERKSTMNGRLKVLLESCAESMPHEEIERRSRIQMRGKLSQKGA
ncbi:DNA cytosine methyltransferase [Adlercreutzia equolifaciens]|uniref:DNA cytosine methyltransferase n=1 Tax=Adlercreutzia equolifaciens TaxID=446660 RepID=UPI0022E2572C|nr:DNA cytosine methyltransferase [Adlercreutzia equolifaciens]